MTPFMTLVADPLNGPLEGAGIPDYNRTPTVMWREKAHVTLSTDVNGNFVVLVAPRLADFYKTAGVTADVIGAYTSFDVPNYTSLSTAFTQVRVLGITGKVSYVGQADTRKGLFYAATVSTLIGAGSTISRIQDEPDYVEATVDMDTAAICRYHNPSFNGLNVMGDALEVIYLGGTGMTPSSADVRLEVSIVFEATVDPAHIMSSSAQHTVVHPAQIDAVANIMGPKTSTAAGSDPIDTLVRHAHRAIDAGAKLNGLWNRLDEVISVGSMFGELFL